MTTPDLPSPAAERRFARWCVLHHARPELARALRAWGLNRAAQDIEQAASLAALRLVASDAEPSIRGLWFAPPRRDLVRALRMLRAAATLAGHSDPASAAAVAIGVFTGAASAITWRRPWTRFGWRKQRAAIIAQARQEQNAQRQGTIGDDNSDHKRTDDEQPRPPE